MRKFTIAAPLPFVLICLLLLSACSGRASPQGGSAAPAPVPSPGPASGSSSGTLPEPYTISAEQAKEVVEGVLAQNKKMYGNEFFPKARVATGEEIPPDAQAGEPKEITKDGIAAYEVPVLSKGTRIGELYVKKHFTEPGRIEFIGGTLREVFKPEWAGQY